MEKNSTEFRDRLLDAQQTTPALDEAYRKQLDDLLNHKLTPMGRLANWFLLFVWVGFAAVCVCSAIVHHGTPRASADFYISVAMYFTVFVLLALGAIRVAWKGQHSWRSYFKVAGMFYGAAGITVAPALLRGLRAPQDPASTFMAIFALVFLIVCLGWALQNRIDASLLTTREHMLRLESRLADLAERIAK